MKCKYCGTDIEIQGEGGKDQSFSPPHGINCPECDSYYYLMEDLPNYWIFNAYPSKYYKQFFQNETLRVLKARS